MHSSDDDFDMHAATIRVNGGPPLRLKLADIVSKKFPYSMSGFGTMLTLFVTKVTSAVSGVSDHVVASLEGVDSVQIGNCFDEEEVAPGKSTSQWRVLSCARVVCVMPARLRTCRVCVRVCVRRRRTGCSTPAVIADTAKLTGCVLRPGSDVAVLPSNYHSFFCKSGTGPELPTQLPGAAAGVLLIQTHDITQSNHYKSGKPSISGLCSRVCGRVCCGRVVTVRAVPSLGVQRRCWAASAAPTVSGT